jgi:hypothetical protein
MIGPTDLLHPSPTPHFKTFQLFLIYCPKCPSTSDIHSQNEVLKHILQMQFIEFVKVRWTHQDENACQIQVNEAERWRSLCTYRLTFCSTLAMKDTLTKAQWFTASMVQMLTSHVCNKICTTKIHLLLYPFISHSRSHTLQSYLHSSN